MNYDKLVHRLRLRVFELEDNSPKEVKLRKILKEAKKRKIETYKHDKIYAKKQDALLFRTS